MTMLSLGLAVGLPLAETSAEESVPAELIGLGTFVLLLVLLGITLLFGKGRPHV